MTDQKPQSKEGLENQERMEIRWTMVANPNTPAHVLLELMMQASQSLLERIAEHPRATEEMLVRLAANECADVRAAVSDNSNASRDILLQLAEDASPDVRYRLAENPNLPLAILEGLTHDDNPYVADRARKTLLRLMFTEEKRFVLPPTNRPDRRSGSHGTG